MGAILVIPLVLALVALVVLAVWVRKRADSHEEAILATDPSLSPRERELEAIRRQHDLADAGLDLSPSADAAYPTDAVPTISRSGHGGPGGSGSRVPYADGAGKDADPLV
jgi:hypothetical protein